MIDTHAHLNFKDFENKVISVVERAKEKGVNSFVVPSSNLETSRRAIALAKRHPEIFPACGLHPVHGAEFSIENLQQFYTLVAAPETIAVGEIGLDYFYLGKTSVYSKYPEKNEQKKILSEMINLAQDAQKPVILHCREAHKDLINFLKSEAKDLNGTIHCFSGEIDQLKQYLDLGYFVSFAGNITYSDDFNGHLEYIPLDRLLLETDCPFLAPEPHRGQKNEPAYMIETAKKIAKIKKISLAELEKATDRNTKKLFKLD